LYYLLGMKFYQSLPVTSGDNYIDNFRTMSQVGYARISSTGKSLDVQLDKLQHGQQGAAYRVN